MRLDLVSCCPFTLAPPRGGRWPLNLFAALYDVPLDRQAFKVVFVPRLQKQLMFSAETLGGNH